MELRKHLEFDCCYVRVLCDDYMIAKTVELGPNILVDYNDSGNVVGVEFIGIVGVEYD